jgi:hypothetical protein
MDRKPSSNRGNGTLGMLGQFSLTYRVHSRDIGLAKLIS